MKLQEKSSVEIAEAREQFSEIGVTVIGDVLENSSAEHIYDVLAGHDPWYITSTTELISMRDWQQMSEGTREQIIAGFHENARHGLEYYFKSYPLMERFKGGIDATLPIMAAARFLTASPFVDLMERVAGIQGLKNVEGLASCFEAGHFVISHTDRQPEGTTGTREIAFILYLTKTWAEDWGAHTCLWSDKQMSSICVSPIFNSMLVFSVPRPHSVLYVPPFVSASRFAITGWLYS